MVSTEEEGPEELLEKVKAACARLNAVSEKPYYLMISVGFYEFTAEEDFDFVEIYKKADEALYERKKHRLPSVRRSVN